ncbi:MAG: hypothetical protein GXO89_03390 [Chlorobi bacterium]|nr:hypothetical protein [Chlorobiota bacterium]
MAGKLFAEKTGKDYRNDGKSFIGFLGLETKMEHDSIDIVKASEKLIEASAIDPILARIENSRRSNIEEYLSRVSDSRGIRVFAPDAKSPKNTGVKPTFEVKYTMKGEGATGSETIKARGNFELLHIIYLFTFAPDKTMLAINFN